MWNFFKYFAQEKKKNGETLVCVCVSVAFSRVRLCDPMDCSSPGSSVHGLLQARILQQVAIPFSRESSQPRDWAHISRIGRWILYHWATREAHMHVHMKGWRGGLIILKHSCSFEKWVFILLTSQREIYVFISLEMSLSISGDILSLGNKNILLV